jgi:hypothetical protein
MTESLNDNLSTVSASDSLVTEAKIHNFVEFFKLNMA